MKLARIILPLSLVALRGLAQDVRYNFAPNVDFTQYKTYKWVDIPNAQKLDQITDQQIKAAIDSEMAKKGFNKATGDTADLFLGYQPSMNQEKQFTSFSNDWGVGPGWRGGWWGPGGAGFSTTTGSTSTIHIGQLDLDVYDSAKKQLVWRGTVTKTLDPKAKPDKQQKNIEKSAAKLMKDFPPKAKG